MIKIQYIVDIYVGYTCAYIISSPTLFKAIQLEITFVKLLLRNPMFVYFAAMSVINVKTKKQKCVKIFYLFSKNKHDQ